MKSSLNRATKDSIGETDSADNNRIQLKLPVDWDRVSPIHLWIGEKTEIVLFKFHERYYAFHSICPHMGAQLTFAAKTHQVSCPWHPLDFDLESGQSNHPKYKKICQYKADVSGDILTLTPA